MFDKYVGYLKTEFSAAFEKVCTTSTPSFLLFSTTESRMVPIQTVTDDDYQPMVVVSASERDKILATCWMPPETAAGLAKYVLMSRFDPNMPFVIFVTQSWYCGRLLQAVVAGRSLFFSHLL